MSEYANPTGIHRNSKYNPYRAQAQGGIDSFDFRGFYSRPPENKDYASFRRRTILGLEDNEDSAKELEKKVEEKDETLNHKKSNDPTKIAPRTYAYCGGLG